MIKIFSKFVRVRVLDCCLILLETDERKYNGCIWPVIHPYSLYSSREAYVVLCVPSARVRTRQVQHERYGVLLKRKTLTAFTFCYTILSI